jgi:hypothetical protein
MEGSCEGLLDLKLGQMPPYKTVASKIRINTLQNAHACYATPHENHYKCARYRPLCPLENFSLRELLRHSDLYTTSSIIHPDLYPAKYYPKAGKKHSSLLHRLLCNMAALHPFTGQKLHKKVLSITSYVRVLAKGHWLPYVISSLPWLCYMW